jgi:hypothetical protein
MVALTMSASLRWLAAAAAAAGELQCDGQAAVTLPGALL